MADNILPCRSLPPFKLKDKVGRGGVRYNLKKTFGFVPEDIIIQKVAGHHDMFILSAVMTQEELDKENQKAKEANEKLDKILS